MPLVYSVFTMYGVPVHEYLTNSLSILLWVTMSVGSITVDTFEHVSLSTHKEVSPDCAPKGGIPGTSVTVYSALLNVGQAVTELPRFKGRDTNPTS